MIERLNDWIGRQALDVAVTVVGWIVKVIDRTTGIPEFADPRVEVPFLVTAEHGITMSMYPKTVMPGETVYISRALGQILEREGSGRIITDEVEAGAPHV